MPQKPFKVVITDNDHGFFTQEKAVFAGSAYELQIPQVHDEQGVIDTCADADGVIGQYAPITARVIAQLHKCILISRYGVGYDTVDVPAATAAGIMVANVPDYGVEEVSLQALTLAMQLYRKTYVCDRSVHAGEWEYRVAEPLNEAVCTKVGVFGTGRIGTALATKMHALGFQVLGCDRIPGKVPSFARSVDFGTLLHESDIISVHCDLNETTRQIFNDAAFSAMKQGVIFVNTSRGGVLDEAALLRALQAGKFSGVGLDVLAKEPPSHDLPLLDFPNVIVTPHVSWFSAQSRVRLKQRTAENVRMALEGIVTPYLVNPEVLQSPRLRFRAK